MPVGSIVSVIPSDIPYHEYIGIALAFLGALGFYLKEWAGGVITGSQATIDTMATTISTLASLQAAAQQPQRPVQSIDKTKLAADILAMAMQAIENASNSSAGTAVIVAGK